MELRKREPLTENFLRDFGPSSLVFRSASSLWREAIATLDKRSDYHVIYENWRNSLRIAYGTSVGDERLFVHHTYLATLAKLLAYLLITGVQTAPEEAQTQEIIQGTFFEKQQILHVPEEGFFSWVGRPPFVSCTQRITSSLANLLVTYRLHELSEDVLKELYQALVDPQDRHDLGEYYTPDWLAARMCNALLSESGEDAVLDPACGSGTFLYQAIQHKKRHLPATRQSLERILGSVVGIDIHPLAVIVAKMNVLLALGDLLKMRSGPVSIQVGLANSLRPLSSGNREPTASLSRLTSLFNQFDIVIGNPPWLSFRFVEKGGYQDYLKHLIVNELGLLEGAGHLITHLELATLFFARCATLYLKRSGKIGFVLPRSIFAADQHDRFRRSCGMGNTTLTEVWDLEDVSPLFNVPAAVAFGDLTSCASNTLPGEIVSGRLKRKNASLEEAKRELKTEATEFHVVQQGKRSFLSTSRKKTSNQRSFYQPHFKEGATIVPRSFWFVEIKAALGPSVKFSERLRRPALRKASGFPTNASLLPAPRAGWKAEPSSLREEVFEGAGPSERRSLSAKQAAEPQVVAETIDPRSDEPARPCTPTELVVATDPRAKAEAKQPYKDLSFEAPIEAEFLYATLLSTDLLPFGHFDFRPVVLPLLEGARGYRLLNAEQACAEGYLKLSEWLERAQAIWEKMRKGKAKKADALTWLNYRNKLTEQNPKAKYVVLYSRSATFLCAAALQVAQTRSASSAAFLGDHEIKLRRFIASDATYFLETEVRREANYLAALLNSPTVDTIIKPMQARGLWGPRDIHKKVWEFPIPEFNPKDNAHLRLAEITEACAEKVKGMVPALKELFRQLRAPHATGRARAAVRKALKDELAEIDGIVIDILN
jgi:hypothetical protein